MFPKRCSRSPWRNIDVTSVGIAERFPKEAGSKPNARTTLSEMTKLVFQVTRRWVRMLAATIEYVIHGVFVILRFVATGSISGCSSLLRESKEQRGSVSAGWF